SRDNRREMTHTRNVVSEKQGPMAAPVEPGVDLFQLAIVHAHVAAELVHGPESKRAADGVAHADAAPTAAHRGSYRAHRMQLHLRYHGAGEHQAPLIGNRDAHDSQHQQKQKGLVAVGRDPVEDKVQAPTIAQQEEPPRRELLGKSLNYGWMDKTRTAGSGSSS